jgi:hypothetical protein
MPSMFSVMKSPLLPGNLEFYFQQLTLLISIVKVHIRNYLPEIFDIIQQCWAPLVPANNISLQITIVSLIQSLATNVDQADFSPCLNISIPLILQILEPVSEIAAASSVGMNATQYSDRGGSNQLRQVIRRSASTSILSNTLNTQPSNVFKRLPLIQKPQITVTKTGDSNGESRSKLKSPQQGQLICKILEAFIIFDDNIEEYLNTLIPAICRLASNVDLNMPFTAASPVTTNTLLVQEGSVSYQVTNLAIQKQAVKCMTQICRRVSVFHHASRIVQCFADVLVESGMNLNSNPQEYASMTKLALDGLSFLAISLNLDFVPFIPRIEKVFSSIFLLTVDMVKTNLTILA